MTIPPPPPLPPFQDCHPLEDLEKQYQLLQEQHTEGLSDEWNQQAQRADRIMQDIRSLAKNNLGLPEVRTAILTHLNWFHKLNLEVKRQEFTRLLEGLMARIEDIVEEAQTLWGFDGGQTLKEARALLEEDMERIQQSDSIPALEIAYKTLDGGLTYRANNLHRKVARHRMEEMAAGKESRLEEFVALLSVDDPTCLMKKDYLEEVVEHFAKSLEG